MKTDLRLFALHVKDEFLTIFRMFQQVIAGLLGKGLKVAYRTGIGCHDTQYLSTGHFGERLFCFQDRQGAIQAPRIEFFLKIHDPGLDLFR